MKKGASQERRSEKKAPRVLTIADEATVRYQVPQSVINLPRNKLHPDGLVDLNVSNWGSLSSHALAISELLHVAP